MVTDTRLIGYSVSIVRFSIWLFPFLMYKNSHKWFQKKLWVKVGARVSMNITLKIRVTLSNIYCGCMPAKDEASICNTFKLVPQIKWDQKFFWHQNWDNPSAHEQSRFLIYINIQRIPQRKHHNQWVILWFIWCYTLKASKNGNSFLDMNPKSYLTNLSN